MALLATSPNLLAQPARQFIVDAAVSAGQSQANPPVAAGGVKQTVAPGASGPNRQLANPVGPTVVKQALPVLPVPQLVLQVQVSAHQIFGSNAH